MLKMTLTISYSLLLFFAFSCGPSNNAFASDNSIEKGDGNTIRQTRGGKRDISVAAKKVAQNSWPIMVDDGTIPLLLKAIKRQKAAFKRSPLKGNLYLGEDRYTLDHIRLSLVAFEKILKDKILCDSSVTKLAKSNCQTSFERTLKERFYLYKPLGSEGESKAHFTGYYSPTFQVTRKKTAKNYVGIFKRPRGSVLRKKTRNQINLDGAFDGKKLDLFWMNNYFDQYILHVEGGGVVELETTTGKKRYYISYDGSNSQKFSFLGKYMVEKGYIKEGTIKAQREFLKNNPDKWREIYDLCPSFIFFRVTKSEPLGLESIPLTPGRSIAQDKKIYKRKGLLTFVSTKRPILDRNGGIHSKTLRRFMIDQDTGGAIKGEARADLYFGYGAEARLIAENLDEKGDLYFLILR